MKHVIRNLALQKLLASRFPIIRKVQQMYQVRFLLLDRLPAKVHNVLEAEEFVVLFPSISYQNRVRIGQRNELEL